MDRLIIVTSHVSRSQCEVAVMDRDDVTPGSDWQCISLGEQQTFGIKTTGLEEKATACAMLVCYARELKQGFANYVEDTVKLMVPHLKFYFHDEVRAAAAESLPFLLDAAQVRGDEYVRGMWSYIAPELLKAIETEPEREVLCEMFYSLAIVRMPITCFSKLFGAVRGCSKLFEVVRSYSKTRLLQARVFFLIIATLAHVTQRSAFVCFSLLMCAPVLF